MVPGYMAKILIDEQSAGQSASISTALSEDIVSEICTSVACVISIYVFGSSHHGSTNKDSDIDLAVRAQEIISSKVLWNTTSALAAICNREVDLIDLRSATTVMRLQIVHHGRKIFCADAIENDRYEDYIYSSYARLNEERAGILEDIRVRGSVYG